MGSVLVTLPIYLNLIYMYYIDNKRINNDKIIFSVFGSFIISD